MLLGNLQRAIDFLRYAEAKNAALLTLSSALAVALSGLLLNANVPSGLKGGLGLSLLLAIVAALFALSTFMPRLHVPTFLGGKPAGPHPKNLLFFGDIASLTIIEFKQLLAERYGPPDAHVLKSGYLDDLHLQVLINSQITDGKMRVFRIGAGVVGAAVAVAGLAVLAWGICYFMG